MICPLGDWIELHEKDGFVALLKLKRRTGVKLTVKGSLSPDVARMDSELDRLSKSPAYKPETFWWGGGVYDLAKRTEVTHLFTLIYPYLSAFAHSSLMSLECYWDDEVAGKGIVFLPRPGSRTPASPPPELVATIATQFVLQLVKEMKEAFSLPLEEDLKRAQAVLDAMIVSFPESGAP